MTEAEKILRRDLSTPCYIGEDGDMALDSRFTRLGAFRKFKKQWKEDTGEDGAEYLDIENMGMRYFRLTTEEEKREYDDADWLITKETTPYMVWYLPVN